jgi:hypothetical protein
MANRVQRGQPAPATRVGDRPDLGQAASPPGVAAGQAYDAIRRHRRVSIRRGGIRAFFAEGGSDRHDLSPARHRARWGLRWLA